VVDATPSETECAKWQTWHCSSPVELLCQWLAVSKAKDNTASTVRIARNRCVALRDISVRNTPTNMVLRREDACNGCNLSCLDRHPG
jgi:hypothetical protein